MAPDTCFSYPGPRWCRSCRSRFSGPRTSGELCGADPAHERDEVPRIVDGLPTDRERFAFEDLCAEPFGRDQGFREVRLIGIDPIGIADQSPGLRPADDHVALL